jgi:uncharacterized membrane protein
MVKDHEPTGPAATYKRDHPPVRNINVEYEKKRTVGQHVADHVTSVLGSWPFIITQSLFLLAWITVNAYLVVMIKLHPGYLRAWDPYPFILLNLVLSFQAAYTGPIVMMSQNRQSEKDRLAAQHDFEINVRAEEEVGIILKQLAHQEQLIIEILDRANALKPAGAVSGNGDGIQDLVRRVEENDKNIRLLLERMEKQ